MKMLEITAEMDHEEEESQMEHEEEGGEAPSDHDEEDQVPEVSGWADAMSKILKSTKPKRKKMLILSRAKKDYEIKRPEVEEPVKKPLLQNQQQAAPAKPLLKRDRKLLKMNRRADPNLEVVTAEGDILEPEPEPEVEEPEVETEPAPVEPEKKRKKKKKDTDAEDTERGDDLISLKAERKLELKRKRLQKEMEGLNRIAPEPTNDVESARERELKKVATKGVVELFNAVNLQKQALGRKLRDAPKSQFKRDKIVAQSKDLFVDALEKISKKGKRRQAEVEVKEDNDMDDSDDYDDF